MYLWLCLCGPEYLTLSICASLTTTQVYQYLQCPEMPFHLDHVQTMQTVCQSLLQLYEVFEDNVRKMKSFGSAEREKVRALFLVVCALHLFGVCLSLLLTLLPPVYSLSM